MTDRIKHTSQELDNFEHDEDLGVKKTMPYEFDGVSGIAHRSSQLARRIYTSGTDTFICYAPAGSSEANAVWQCFKIDASGNQYNCDGNIKFDNVADDGVGNNASTLSYS